MRTVKFYDKYGDRIHPRKFYRDLPITGVQMLRKFDYNYTHGFYERVLFVTPYGALHSEIIIERN